MAAAPTYSLSKHGGVLIALLVVFGLAYMLQRPPGVHSPSKLQSPAAAATRFHQAPCPGPRKPGTRRRNLVFAAVGDKWTPDKWSFSGDAGWDLVAVYYGNRTEWSCPKCTLALHMPESMKWQMLWALMTAGSNKKRNKWAGIWSRLKGSYDYILVADDDLVMDACTIDLFFESMRRNRLLAAQPSNCRGSDSDNPYWVHWQLPGLELHYVNVIEVTAPGLDMKFLDTQIRPYLQSTFSGWGLPFCFWAAAGFPTNKLAAVDAACMIHPTREDVGEKLLVSERIRRGLVKPGSIYARFAELTPFESPRKEQEAVWKECGFLEPKARGNKPAILGTVLAAPQAAAAAANAALSAAGEQAAAATFGWQRRWQLAQVWREPVVLCLLAFAGCAGAAAALQRCRQRGQPRKAVGTRLSSASPVRP